MFPQWESAMNKVQRKGEKKIKHQQDKNINNKQKIKINIFTKNTEYTFL